MKGWVALVAALVAATVPVAAEAVVTSGTITASRGAAGIRLGMTRPQVVAELGQPLYENANGYMQYGPDTGPLFDVYRDVFTSPSRVRMIGVSGWNFCFSGGPCLGHKNGVADLKAKFGTRLKIVYLETGEPVYRVSGRYRGCATFTDITPRRFKPGAPLLMVFIGFKSGGAC